LPSRHQLAKLTVTQLRLTLSVVEFDSRTTDFGIVIDSQLSMDLKVSTVSCLRFYQLYQLIVLQRSATKDALRSLLKAFVHCQLDYCNAISTGS